MIIVGLGCTNHVVAQRGATKCGMIYPEKFRTAAVNIDFVNSLPAWARATAQAMIDCPDCYQRWKIEYDAAIAAQVEAVRLNMGEDIPF